jgi:glycosyltransferase involved in cell wall biosynthesis
VSVHWVSQVLGPGRGLEDLFTALPMVRGDVEIHLRGNRPRGFEAWLETNVAASHRDRIFVHDLVETKELLSRIAEHDIGFAGEMKYCASKDLTVSNKILHYLLGGCAVVASDTIGQKEVATMAGDAVSIYPSGNPGALADALNALIDSPDRLNAAKAAALRAAEKTFCWERQGGEFVDVVTQAVRRAGASR